MKPRFDLDKIKHGTDASTWQRAIDLYKRGKVVNFKEAIASYTADVVGTHIYHVSVEARDYRYCYCTCYLGQNDTLCKHAVAVAIYTVKNGKGLTKEEEIQVTKPISSNILGEMSASEIDSVKKEITRSISYIKYYRGPSKIWFAYQNSLEEGVNRLSTIICKLPISVQTTGLVVQLLLRLDRKLQGGVDDSDGTVGDFIQETVEVLKEYAKQDKDTVKSFKKLIGIHSTFDWEEPLVEIFHRVK